MTTTRARQVRGGWVAVMVMVTIIGSAAPAAAEDRKVALERLSGPGADEVRDALIRVFTDQEGYRIIPDRRISTTAKKLGVSTDSSEGYAAIAKELGVVAFVGGTISGGKKSRAAFWVRNGADGEVLVEGAFSGANAGALAANVNETFWKRMGNALSEAKAPAGGSGGGGETVSDTSQGSGGDGAGERASTGRGGPDAEVARSGDQDDASEDEARSGERPVALDIQVGARLFTRKLTYTDDIYGALRPYSLSGAPAPGFALDWFPAAHAASGPLANIGLTAAGESAVLLGSTASSGAEYPTTSASFMLGLRYRFLFDELEASGTAAYGTQSFAIKDASPTEKRPPIPNVDYKYLRLGAAARAALGARVSLLASASYLVVLSSGEISEAAYFPRSTAAGVDAAVGLAYGLGNGLEARVGADVRRYFYTMNPTKTDATVAGGAVDQYLALTLGVAYRMGGTR